MSQNYWKLHYMILKSLIIFIIEKSQNNKMKSQLFSKIKNKTNKH